MNAEKNRSLDEQELVVVVGSVPGKLECEALVVRIISYQNNQLKILATSLSVSKKQGRHTIVRNGHSWKGEVLV
ncbi:MAG: hypothetical protein HC938_04645 [Nitrospira sp.]|nr:hypothetical protein [Nitrospira sp.]